MATEAVMPQVAAAKHFSPAHPLCPLSPAEISQSASIIKSLWPAGVELRFKTITLFEPEKKLFLPYLDAEHSGKALPALERKAFTTYMIKKTVCPRVLLVKSKYHHWISPSRPAWMLTDGSRINHMKL